MKVSLAGGAALAIMHDPTADYVDWGPDDTIVFGTTTSGLFRVSAAGGDPEPLTTPTSQVEVHTAPHFLPHGRAVLFEIASPSGGASLAAYSFDTAEWHELSLKGGQPRYSLGHIIFARTDSLWAVPFETDRLAITGDPFLVVEGVATIGPVTPFDVAQDGTLIYAPEGSVGGAEQRILTWIDREGRPTPLREEPRAYRTPRFSPDGRRLLLQIRDEGINHVWVQDVERTPSRR